MHQFHDEIPSRFNNESNSNFREVINEAEERSLVSTNGYVVRQSRPLAEQTIDDFDEFFRRCDGLSFVFLGWGPDQVNTVWPDIFSAIALADAAFQKSDYEPPYAGRRYWSLGGENPLPKSQVMKGVQTRVEEMRRRTASCLLIWVCAGDKTVNVDGDLDASANELADFLATETQQYLTG